MVNWVAVPDPSAAWTKIWSYPPTLRTKAIRLPSGETSGIVPSAISSPAVWVPWSVQMSTEEAVWCSKTTAPVVGEMLGYQSSPPVGAENQGLMSPLPPCWETSQEAGV